MVGVFLISMIKIDTNVTGVIKALNRVKTSHRNAFVRALNGLAYDIRDAEVEEMKRVFDRPTPYVLNSIKVKRATATNLAAMVWFRDSENDWNYILPNVYGGDRRQKNFERRLYKIGLLKRNEVLVPATKAGVIRLDRYGNVSRGQYVQILSQLQAFGDQGFSANETPALRKKRSAKHYSVRYFFARNTEEMQLGDGLLKGVRRQHLKSGIWARYKTAFGTAVKPVFFVADQANYERRFNFHKVGKNIADLRWKDQMGKAYIIEKNKFLNQIAKK